jgi:hypothetical protein
MDRTGDHHVKLSQSHKDKYCVFFCMWNLGGTQKDMQVKGGTQGIRKKKGKREKAYKKQ